MMPRIICYVEIKSAILVKEFESFEECANWIREVRRTNKVNRVLITG